MSKIAAPPGDAPLPVPETGAEFRARWAAVNAFQNEELRRLTPDERFQQLEGLYMLKDSFNEDPKAEEELAAVRKRWAEIRRRFLERPWRRSAHLSVRSRLTSP